MYCFHATVHVEPYDVPRGPEMELRGELVRTLAIRSDQLDVPFPISFETAAEALLRLDRLFIEPDGSFVWRSDPSETAWLLDGHLFDRNERLLFAELKGTCAPDSLDRLLEALGWPILPLVFQLQREAVILAGPEFRCYAELPLQGS